MARTQCASCATWQEVSDDDVSSPPCEICGAPLSGSVPAGASTLANPATTFGLVEDADIEVFDVSDAGGSPIDLDESAPSRRPAEIDEIFAAERRWIGFSSLIPLWGLWRASRSQLHTSPEKWLLGAVSVLTTLLVAAAVWQAQPTRAEERERLHAEISAQLDVLRSLVERYRSQYGTYPDADAWARSAGRADRRFTDPWGRRYVYEPLPDGFRLGTYGADGLPDGTGVAADVFLEEIPESG